MEKCFEGIIVPVVTPFDKKGELKLGALDVIVDFLLEHEIHGIMPLGSQGEFFSLTSNEKRAIIDFVIKKSNGGFTPNSTGGFIWLTSF